MAVHFEFGCCDLLSEACEAAAAAAAGIAVVGDYQSDTTAGERTEAVNFC